MWRSDRSGWRVSFTLLILLLLFKTPAWADPIPIGLLSFDLLLPGPGGVNTLSLGNFTGDPATPAGFAIPPNFPVLTPVTFNNSHLLLALVNGGTQNIALGNIGPGFSDTSGLLQFADTTAFRSVTFTATLSETHFLLSGGVSLDAIPSITTLLTPSTGGVLVAGSDFAIVSVSPVPLPGSLLLMGSGLVILWAWRLKQMAHVRRS